MAKPLPREEVHIDFTVFISAVVALLSAIISLAFSAIVGRERQKAGHQRGEASQAYLALAASESGAVAE